MSSFGYKKHVDTDTAMSLTIPETAIKWNISAYMVKKLARECGAYVQIGSSSRILQKEFGDYFRSFAIKK